MCGRRACYERVIKPWYTQLVWGIVAIFSDQSFRGVLLNGSVMHHSNERWPCVCEREQETEVDDL